MLSRDLDPRFLGRNRGSETQPRFDVTSFGESMLRLSVPAGQRLEVASTLDVCPAGAESNVLSLLARLDKRCSWISGLPANPAGRLIANQLRMAGVDLDSMRYCSQAVLPHMLALGHGSIVNMASIHAFQIIAGCFPYPVAKHGVIGLTRALAIEYAAQNIRVNAICPGYVETQITIDYWNTFNDPDAQRLYAYNIHPPKRIGTANEVAWPIVFLASDEASFINGAALMVDGGRSVLYHD